MKNLNSILKQLTILILMCGNNSCAQTGNRINFKSHGISFVIPTGWIGQETGSGYVLTSKTIPGFMLVATNTNSDINTMISEAQNGISDGNGNYLQLTYDIEKLSNIAIGGEYQGVMEGQPAKTYIIGIANTVGSGISIMAATTPEYYSDKYKQLCINIANSVELDQPIQSKKASKMEKLFGGARLSYYNTGDGYSTKIIIDLCEQGYFHHSSYDSMSANVGGVSAGFGGDKSGAGTWSIIENTNEKPILQLKFHNGKLYEYYITFNGKETYLDNRRYFRVYGEDGARCN